MDTDNSTTDVPVGDAGDDSSVDRGSLANADAGSEIDWGSPSDESALTSPQVATGGETTSTPATARKDAPPHTATSSAPPGGAVVKLPPRDDHIWGATGIMHGLAPKVGGIKRTIVLDHRYDGEKRPADVFGHNGLTPGDWFPNQMAALFHGGHGSRIGGVYGKEGKGTYSVVVSGQYKEVDNECVHLSPQNHMS